MDEERFYTIPEAAEKLRVKRDVVYKWMKHGQLTYVKVGKERRITSSGLAAFVKLSTEAPIAPTAPLAFESA